MPIYSYRCRDCGEVFDLLEGLSGDQVRRRCPRCSGRALTKIHAAFNVGPAEKSGRPGTACPTCPSGPAGCAGGSCPF